MTTNMVAYPPHSIRQLKERVTNLRGKHKQMYSVAVKEADPKVNWDALVDEKLVWPRAGLSLSTSALLIGDAIMKSSEIVYPRAVGLREEQYPAWSHTARPCSPLTMPRPLMPTLLVSLQAGQAGEAHLSQGKACGSRS